MSAQLTLPSSPSTPTELAATLLVAIYGQHAQELAVSEGSSLSLSTLSGEVTLPALSTALFSAAGKSNDALGSSADEQPAVQSWLDRIGKGEFQSEEAKKTLDKELEKKTFLVGKAVTAADLALFASLHPFIANASHSTLLSIPSVTRHFDHIQHLPLTTSALSKSSVFSPSVVAIDVQNVPVVPEPKSEPKAKKPKAGEATAAPVAEDKTPAPVTETKEAPAPAEKKDGVSEKKPKAEKKPKGDGGKKAPPAAPVNEAPAPWMVDLRVGKIVEVALHPDADSLYVEKIDVGEAEPRTVVSGLVKYIPIDQMMGKTLITVCNLKPANMRGVKSFAMVLCASSKEGKDGGVEFVDPPAGSLPGDRVYFEGFEEQTALDVLNPKKKIFETVQPGFTTLDNKEAAWISDDKKTHRIVTSKGVCSAPTFIGASLS